MPKFEIIVYNREVRMALDKMQPNETGLEDKWADNNYIVIDAKSADEVRREVKRRYPEERGFVVNWSEPD